MKFLFYPIAIIVTLWTKSKEAHGQKIGRSLTPQEKKALKPLNIKSIDKIRVVVVDEIILPFNFIFKWLSQFSSAIITNPIGLTLGYSIFIKSEYMHQFHLLAHEAIHVRQYESKGSHFSFLTEYIYQCIIYGYTNSPLEKEAETISADLQKRVLWKN